MIDPTIFWLSIWLVGFIVFFGTIAKRLTHDLHQERWRDMATPRQMFIRLFIISALWFLALPAMWIVSMSPQLRHWIETGEWLDD